jgi:hypothetical protein
VKLLSELSIYHDEGKQNYDVDLFVKVLHIFATEDGRTSELRVIDSSNQVWFTTVYTSKFRWLKEG